MEITWSKREGSNTTKIYQDGKYIDNAEDAGYQSSSPSEGTKQHPIPIKDDTFAFKNKRPLLTVEKVVDPLSRSLPEYYLKQVKSDLDESMRSNGKCGKQSKGSGAKVVYDPRIFKGSTQNGLQNVDPEEEYFAKSPSSPVSNLADFYVFFEWF